MIFKLRKYDKEYYKIYNKRRKVGLDAIPSFRWIKLHLTPGPNDTILDAGCGNGEILEFLCDDTGAKGVGIDISPVALDMARQKFPSHEYHQGDLTQLHFPDNHFDKIVCFNVIEHIHDQNLAMQELKRVLRPEGIIIMGTNIRDSLSWWLYQRIIGEHTHTHEFTVREFLDFVSRYFQIVDWSKSSGVFRVPKIALWVFHTILLGDILIKSKKNKCTPKG